MITAEGKERLDQIADQLQKNEKPAPMTVRRLLGYFNSYRRGWYVTQSIREALESRKLETIPDFATTWIDAPLEFGLLLDGTKEGQADTAVAAEMPAQPVIGENAPAEMAAEITGTALVIAAVAGADPTYRIGRLPSANQGIVPVTADGTVVQAITLMMQHDFSQLPVMQGTRDVKGIISWSSIGSRLVLGRTCTTVRDCMEQHREIGADESLFDAIPVIVGAGYVLVRAADKTIIGIVTASDLSLQFQQMTEPFLILGEIEQHIRKMIEKGRFAVEELRAAKDPEDAEREVNRVADLTLGEYIRLLENPDRWAKLNLRIDRTIFITELNKVKLIRNDVMHFDPDPLGEEDTIRLREFVRFLQRLDEILPD
jgi:CBS domain-containing protein